MDRMAIITEKLITKLTKIFEKLATVLYKKGFIENETMDDVMDFVYSED